MSGYPHYPEADEAQHTGYPLDTFDPAPSYGPPVGQQPRRNRPGADHRATSVSPPPQIPPPPQGLYAGGQDLGYGHMPSHSDNQGRYYDDEGLNGGGIHQVHYQDDQYAQQQHYQQQFPPDPSDLHSHAHTGISGRNPFDDPDGHDMDAPLLGQGGRHGGTQLFDHGATGGGGMSAGGFNPNIVGAEGAGLGETEEQSLVRYGKIPQRQPRRYKTVKRVQLYHGNLVLDCPVPTKLLEKLPKKSDREFTHMRYTAATCDPNDFFDERYSLRQVLYEQPRRTELFIVMTMYNEDEELFTRTMHGVMKNIQHLCTRSRSKTWGAEGWKKATICIVSDGRDKVNTRTLSVLAAMGVYQDGVAKNVVAGKPVTAHIYEYTTQISIDPEMKEKGADRGLVPVQIIFCLKEKNAKKINSHRWFFNAFGPVLKPNICILLDVGTQPGPQSIYRLWKTFDNNSNVGGACGEIVALKGRYLRNLLNPLVAAQNFEYKMSNILDKPLESVFGYITVLPGAFSAYRYIALQNDKKGEGPLREYFKGETLHHSADADLWTKNMYLAEDRILCWELVSKRESKWVLHYVRSAYAITDVPSEVPELISQRRRWLNGSFFAAIHATVHFGYIYRSDHTWGRKFWLHFELVYQIFTMAFAWLALGNWYITFSILTRSLEDPSFGVENIKYFNMFLNYLYIALLVMCFLLAMGNRPQGSAKMFTFMMVCFGVITVYMLVAAGIITYYGIVNVANAAEGGLSLSDIFTNAIFRNIVISLLATYGLYLLASLIALDPYHMVTSFFQYLLLAPSYTNVINVYAFCNVNDISWGTKGDHSQKTDLGVVKTDAGAADVAIPTNETDINAGYDDAWAVLSSPPPKVVKVDDLETRMTDAYRAIRTNVVMAWALTNGALVAGILSSGAGASYSVSGSSATVNGYMLFLLSAVAGLALVRFIGTVTYTIAFLFQG